MKTRRFRPSLCAAAVAAACAAIAAPPAAAADFTCSWASAATNSWNVAAAWTACNSTFPNSGASTYSAVINAVGPAYTVNLSTVARVENLTLNSANATLSLNSGAILTLDAGASVQAGNLRLNGGVLRGGTLELAAPTLVSFTPSGANALDGVAVRGPMTMSSGYLRAINGTSFSGPGGVGAGTVNVSGSSTYFAFDGAAPGWVGSLDNATFNLSSGAFLTIDRGANFTFGSGVTVRGTGSVGTSWVQTSGPASSLSSAGLISADATGSALTLGVANTYLTSVTNASGGIVEARNAGILNINAATFTNQGLIRVADATSRVNLNGTFAGGLGNFQVNGGAMVLVGTIQNTGQTLDFTSANGSMRVEGGRIVGGTVQQVGANGLRFNANGTNVLDNVTLRGTLPLTGSSEYVTLVNGVTLTNEAGTGPGVANVTGSSSFLNFDGTAAGWSQSFDNATVNLGTVNNYGYVTVSRGGTLTLGPGAVVRGYGGVGTTTLTGGGAATIVNLGTISADVSASGSTRQMDLGTASANSAVSILTNGATGVLEARSGGTLNIAAGSLTNAGQIRVVDATSTVLIRSNVTTGGLGQFRNDAGGSLQFFGTLNNVGETLHFSPVGDSNRGTLTLNGGRIVGGTVQQVGSNGLRFATNGGNTLDATTVRGDLQLTGNSQYVTFANAVTLTNEAGSGPGVANVTGSGSYLNFDGAAAGWSQSFDNATVNLGTVNNYGYLTVSRSGTLTLGPAVLVRGYGAVGTTTLTGGGTATLVNLGTISADVSASGSTRQMDLGTPSANSAVSILTNGATGVLEARSGGTLSIAAASLTNAGQIRVVDATSTVQIRSNVTTGGLGRFRNDAGGSLQLFGTLNNAGETLHFSPAGDANRGTLTMQGGRIVGGTVQQVGANGLRFSSTSSVIDGANVRGALLLTGSSHWVTLVNGTTLTTEDGTGPGVAQVTGSSAYLNFDGAAAGWSQSFDNATVNLGTVNNYAYLTVSRGGTLTLGPGAVVRGYGGVGTTTLTAGGSAAMVNLGTVSADVSSSGSTRTIDLGTPSANTAVSTLTNGATGVLEARSGGTLSIAAASLTNAGQIRVVDATSTVQIRSNVTTGGLGRFRNDAGGSLQFFGTLNNAGETLHFSPVGDENRGTMTMQGGRIVGGTVQQVGANGLRFSSSTSTLDGVTVRGDLQLTGSSHWVTFANGVTLTNEAGTGPGVVSVTGSSAYLNFDGAAAGWSQSFDNATVNLGTVNNYAFLTVSRGGTLTLGPGAVVRGYGGVGTTTLTAGGAATIVNLGTISADVGGSSRRIDLGINSTGAVNTLNNGATGVLEARNGGTLDIQATNLSNAGQIRVVDATSTVQIRSNVTTGGLGRFRNDAGGSLQLFGTINNAGETLHFSPVGDENRGTMTMQGGRIVGGTVQQVGANGLRFSSTTSTLDGVTVRGDLQLTGSSHWVTFANGVTLTNEAGTGPGVVNVTGSSAYLNFDGAAAGWSQSFDNATVNLGTVNNYAYLTVSRGGTLTLGPNAVVRGYGGVGTTTLTSGGAATIVNLGTISADVSGSSRRIDLGVNSTNAVNVVSNGASGVLEARSGGTLDIQATNLSNAGQIRVVDATSTVQIRSNVTTGGLGRFRNDAGGSLQLLGTINNAGETLHFSPVGDTNRGTMTMQGGRITGGTVQQVGANGLRFSSTTSTLDGVTVRGDVQLTGNSNFATFVNGVTLTDEAGTGAGVVNVTGSNAYLNFDGAAAGWSQSFDNATINLGTVNNYAYLTVSRGGTLTLGPTAVVRGYGGVGNTIQTAAGTATIVNLGTISADIGGSSRRIDLGTASAGSGVNTLTNGATGVLEARNGGTLDIYAASITNFAAGTLSGGTWRAVGNGSIVQLRTAGTVSTNAANLVWEGAGSVLRMSNPGTGVLTTIESTLATNTAAGAVRVLGGRNFANGNAFANSGVVELGGGSFTPASIGNAATGEIFGFGTLGRVVANSGTVRAAGGTLNAPFGIDGQSGTIAVDPGATLVLGAASDGDFLRQDGTLNLATFNVTVDRDYTNANWGSGNSFDRRAGVVGTGQIVGLNAAQGLAGQVAGGGPNLWIIDFGNVRGGTSADRTFQIANSGTGADIRGALQTGAPGLGGITDGRLSGSGVTAANFGPVAAGANSGNLTVTLTAGTSGGSLAQQSFAFVSNFDNVATQTISVSGFTTVLAQGAVAPVGPVNLGNFRVGVPPMPSTAIAATNLTTGAGAERLGIAGVATSGNFAAVNNLGAGFVDPGATFAGAVTASVNGGVTGPNAGSVTLSFSTNGALIDPAFGTIASNSAAVALAATGYLQAQPALPAVLDLGKFRAGQGASAALPVTNTLTAPGFQEALDGAAGTTSAGVLLAGSFTQLAAGGTSNALTASFAAGGAAGARTGTATVLLTSNGTGSSGLAPLGLDPVMVQLVGTAYRTAAASAVSPNPVVMPNQRVGGTMTQSLSLSNLASNDGFSESLNASIAASGTALAGGAVTLLAPGANSTALFVGVDTTVAGARGGNATVSLFTDGTGSSDFGATALGTQTVAVSGNVYRLATPSLLAPNPVVLANQRVGGNLQGAVSVTNTAAVDGFSEALSASITAGANANVAGGVTLLAPGATAGTMFVGVNTAIAGVINGTATVQFFSDGQGSSGLPAVAIGTQDVAVSGAVFNLAAAAPIDPAAIVVPAQRVGGTATVGVNVANAAPLAFSERLNGSVGATLGQANAGGGFTLLAAGATSAGDLFVGVDTSAAGQRQGQVRFDFVSDGAGTSGIVPMAALPSQTVSVAGDVYRLALPQVDLTPIVLAGRVGDTVSPVAVAVLNNGADAFTERLNASWAPPAPAGFSLVGQVGGLGAGQSSSAMTVTLSTAEAGSFGGNAVVALVSSGVGTTGAPDAALGTAAVPVTGRVYAPAVAAVTPVVDFGIVRVGEAVAARAVTVAHQGTAALNDRLNATFAPAAGPFTTAGTVAGLEAGQSNAAALTVQLDTAAAGVYQTTANVALSSTNPDLAPLSLPSADVLLQGQVNRLAGIDLALVGGGALSFDGLVAPNTLRWTLNLGTVVEGLGTSGATLLLLNPSAAPADALAGAWVLGPETGGFALAGFGGFSIGAGGSSAPLGVTLLDGTVGTFTRTVGFQGLSVNGFGPDLQVAAVELRLLGEVAPIPEPSTYALMLGGVLGVLALVRRRRIAAG